MIAHHSVSYFQVSLSLSDGHLVRQIWTWWQADSKNLTFVRALNVKTLALRFFLNLFHYRPDEVFHIGFEVRQGRGRHSVTTVVTFKPRYMLENLSGLKLQVGQLRCTKTRSGDLGRFQWDLEYLHVFWFAVTSFVTAQRRFLSMSPLWKEDWKFQMFNIDAQYMLLLLDSE